jgi:HEAT repeat protein
LHVRDRRVVDVDTYVGGRWRSGSAATDLGLVSAPEAADYLLSLAATLDDRAGREAIVPAVLADSTTVWPRLLAIAKDGTRRRGTRRSAVFWLGQAAWEHATRGLEEIIDDDEAEVSVREQAVFALSQQSTDEGVTALIRIARSHSSAGIRKKALFWLGQSDDPRAVGLFEEILLQP